MATGTDSQAARKPQPSSAKKKFSYKEQREYDTIEDDITAKEEAIAKVEAEISNSVSDFIKLSSLSAEKEQLEAELDQLLERYVYLTELAESFQK